MKAILHIGREKTGTTNLQGFLSRNREALLAREVHYSRALGEENHIALTAYALSDEVRDTTRKWLGVGTAEELRTFREMLRASLAEEAGRSPAPVMVMSNEHCSARLKTPEEVRRLRDLLASCFDEVEVVVYLRRQDELLLSIFSTSVKAGRTEPLGPGRAAAVARRFDHLSLLEVWTEAFGGVTARLHSADVVGDFCALLGIDPSGLDRLGTARNESLDAARLEFLRLLNQHLPAVADNGGNLLRGDLAAVMERASTGPRPEVPVRFLDRVMEEARESNAAVADRWFGGVRCVLGDPLFGERAAPQGGVPLGSLTVEQAAETAAAMWKHCQAEIQRLREENDRLHHAIARMGHPSPVA